MNADEIADNFSLDEACKIATCDNCGFKFDIDNGLWFLEEHFKNEHQ